MSVALAQKNVRHNKVMPSIFWSQDGGQIGWKSVCYLRTRPKT